MNPYILLDWLNDLLDSKYRIIRNITVLFIRFLSQADGKAIWLDSPYVVTPRWKKAIAHVWNPVFQFAGTVSFQMQEKVEEVTGHLLCEYCCHVVYPNHAHEYCDKELNHSDDYDWSDDDLVDSFPEVVIAEPVEIDWDLYPGIDAVDGDEDDDQEYDWRDHSYEDDPDFDPYGYSDEEFDDDQPVQVWFTERPGGHNSWE